MKNVAIITGASSGMGEEFARQVENWFTLDEVWLIARREEGLRRAAGYIKKASPRILTLDLETSAGILALKNILDEEKPVIKFLAANAGYGKFGGLGEVSREHNLGMINLNVYSLTSLVYDSLPYLKKGSGVVLLGSLAAYVSTPGLNVYGATKAYVRSFGLSLHSELAPQGISVTTLCPGPVETEFSKVASGGKPDGHLSRGMSASKVVKKTFKALKRNQSLILPRMDWTLAALLTKLVPGTLIARILRNLFR